jgi:hypothetical protein
MCPACITTIGVIAACAISTQALAEIMDRRTKADATTNRDNVDKTIKLKGGRDVSTEKCGAR